MTWSNRGSCSRARVAVAFVVMFKVFVLTAQATAAEFMDPAEAFRGQARALADNRIELRIDVAPSYHLYRERISVETGSTSAQLGSLEVPRGDLRFDKAFGKEVELLRGTVVMPLQIQRADADFTIRVRHQGCADEGLCYPPQVSEVRARVVDGHVSSAGWQLETTQRKAEAGQASRLESALKAGNLAVVAGVFLVAGLLLSLTPCVLPMVPILSSIIVGQGTAVSRRRGLSISLCYALGMAMVYTAFGVAAGLLGEGLAAALQTPWVLASFALVLVLLALSMFGAFELQVPTFLQSRIADASRRLPGGSHAGVFAMGGLSALVVSPCVVGPLAGALVFISHTRDVVIGGLALFCLAMGMSAPLMLVGVSAGALLPRAGGWMNKVKASFGVMLLGVALWIVSPVLPATAKLAVVGVALLVAAVYLRVFDGAASPTTGWSRFARGMGLALAVVGAVQIVGAMSGGGSPWQPLAGLPRSASVTTGTGESRSPFRRIRTVGELDVALKAAGQTAIVDFHADWCVSCKELEVFTFSDPGVSTRMASALRLRVDVTANSVDDKALLRRFGLFGPPAVLFFDAEGKENTAARVIGFLPPDSFSASLTAMDL